MKTRKLTIATVWLATAALIWSCDDSKIAPELQQETSIANNILTGSNAALKKVRGAGFGGPIGAIYGNSAGRVNGRAATPLTMIRSINGKVENEDTDIGIGLPDMPDCAVETWEDDGNGSYTYTLDFGNGCDYYGETMKGKMVDTGSYTDNSFNSSVVYTNFGGKDWFIDGSYSYSGTWEDDSNNSDSLAIWIFNASYEFTADLTEKYIDYGFDSDGNSTGETSVTVDYVANGAEVMDEKGYTVKSRSESVNMDTGESFTTKVDSPLIMDYNCGDVWIFVSGVESGSYTNSAGTSSYSINYGDGTCDNIIQLTEDGVTKDVDLGDVWDEWEEGGEANNG